MKYHKIQSIYKRDERGKFIIGEYSRPEFEFLKDNLWEFTEKIDGTNIRIIFEDNKIRFGGKTDNAQILVFLYDKLNEIFIPLLDTFKKIFKVTEIEQPVVVVLYGEGFGAGIQKGGGKYIKDGVDFILFDIKIGDIWLKRKDVEDIGQKLGIKVVEKIGVGTLDTAINLVKKGLSSAFGDFTAEGLVLRPLVEMKDRLGGRIITKIKYRDFN